jgi:hypothetical protein
VLDGLFFLRLNLSKGWVIDFSLKISFPVRGY